MKPPLNMIAMTTSKFVQSLYKKMPTDLAGILRLK
jgi:hypothetical protein